MPRNRDVKLDDNRYQVRAISLTPKNPEMPEYEQLDGVAASFSLDNVDDVPPLGPTNITGISDIAGAIDQNEDGSYIVSLIVDEPALAATTDVTFTIKPTADETTYVGGKVILVQTAPDGTVMEFENAVEAGQVTINVDEHANENGIYTYYALVEDSESNRQANTEEEGMSPITTVNVQNFRASDIQELMVTGVDGKSVDENGFLEVDGKPLKVNGEDAVRIPLRDSIDVSFNVADTSWLAVGDLTGVLVAQNEVMFTASSDADNMFALMAEKLSDVVDGWYTAEGEITKRNGSITFPLADINLDNTGPMIVIKTPTVGATVNDLPTLLASLDDGDLGSGVSAQDTAVVTLVRIRPKHEGQVEVDVDVDDSLVEQNLDSLVYTGTNNLSGGAYTFKIQVADSLGTVGTESVTFAIEGLNPTVVITAPASGQTFDASPESITGFFAGGGEVSVTKFSVNDVDMDITPDGNNFTYMPAEGFSEGDHKVNVEVTDGSGLTAETSLTFTVELPIPTVSIAAPGSW